MTHLILFACPGMPTPDVVKQYEVALEPLGSVNLAWIAKAGFSSVFTQIGHDCRDPSGRVLPRLLARYAPNVPHHTVSLISYSAGFGLARELLRDERDREALDAFVALDSVHGPRAATGLASEPFTTYAERAAAGDCLFALAHTDVPVGPYLSTTAMAEFLTGKVPEGGHWYAKSYDTAPPDKAQREHGNALVLWGASFAADALVPYLGSLAPAPAPVAPGPLGERLLAWYLAEQAAGVCESPPGSNSGKRIAEYHSLAIRNGKRIGLSKGPWCASMASFGLVQVGAPDWFVPRCSGYELEQDAKAAGYFAPQPAGVGDLCILGRGGEAWQRHVCCVVDMPDDGGQFSTVGGNEGDRVRITDRCITDAAVKGFVVLPRPGAVEQVGGALVDAADKVARVLVEMGRLYV